LMQRLIRGRNTFPKESNLCRNPNADWDTGTSCAGAKSVDVEVPVGPDGRWHHAVLAGATAALDLLLLPASGIRLPGPRLCAGVFTGCASWLCLYGVDAAYGHRARIRSIRPFLARYAASTSVAGGVAALLGLYAADRLFGIWAPPEIRIALSLAAVVALVTALLSIAGFAQALHTEVRDTGRIRQMAAKAEIKALKAQINPHFLFNTLNSILQLVKVSPGKAETMLLNLAGALRFVLRSIERETVSLAEEVEFLKAYLEIEQSRFAGTLRVAFDIPAEALGLRIPPCILQLLVENAIRHGIAPKTGGGRIGIAARMCRAGFTVSVEDDGVGLNAGARSASCGIGLRNVQDRLLACVGPRGRLDIESRAGEGTKVSFFLPASVLSV
jgi:hypothetical protein